MQERAWPQSSRITLASIPAVWRWCVPVWFLSRLALWCWGAFLWMMRMIPGQPAHAFYYEIQPVQTGLAAPFLWTWLRWDGVNYLRIAQSGYNAEDLSAFFPLYPLLARWLSPFTGGSQLAALLLVSNLAFLGVLVLLYQLVEQDFDAPAAKRAVVAAVLFPTAFFFFTPYPQALALLTTLAAYTCARRSKWLLAAVFGLVTGLTHTTVQPTAILLAILVFRSLRQQWKWTRLGLFAVALTPLLGYAAYLAWRVHAGFPPLLELMQSLWGVYPTLPWKAIAEIPLMVKGPFFATVGWVDILMFLLAAGMILRGYRRIPWEAWFYQVSLLICLLMVTTPGGPLHGMMRYILIMFPLYVEIGLWTRTKLRKLFAVGIGVALQLYLASLYLLWAWVA
ncbi:MAG TPA: mannosyltransferase family protein [Anaerolineaceae bacterium]|nr:mannosyltransferase family protein [Anaerolineaceae bacterium]